MALSQWQKGTGWFDARSMGGQIAIKALEFDFSSVNNYPAGGVDCDIRVFYNGKKHAAIVAPKSGYIFEYDAENGKLLVYVAGSGGGPLDEVADQTDLSSIGKVQILAWGV